MGYQGTITPMGLIYHGDELHCLDNSFALESHFLEKMFLVRVFLCHNGSLS